MSDTSEPRRLRRLILRTALAAAIASTAALVLPATSPAGATPFTFGGPAFAIADAGPGDTPTTSSGTVNVPANTCSSGINDMNVAITWAHTFNNDLRIQLRSPLGTLVTLIDDEGSDTDNGEAIFDDEAEVLAEDVNLNPPNGRFIPEQALTAFNGQNPTGGWQLLVHDEDEQDVGSVDAWSVQFNCFDPNFPDFSNANLTTVAIPDEQSGVTSVDVGQCGTITDVNVEAVFQHNFLGDLTLDLTHAGQTVSLANLANFGALDGGAWLRFDDEEPDPIQDGVPTTEPPFRAWNLVAFGSPDEPLSDFDGLDGSGTWTLTVSDNIAQDDGEIQQFGLDVTCDPDPCDNRPEDGFTDVGQADVHESNIDCIAFFGIAQGTSATTYSPTLNVSRAQMASFVARMIQVAGISLPANPPDAFPGDNAGPPHELAINQLAQLGVVDGSNGATGANYNVSAQMRRDHMASFLANAYEVVFGVPMAPGPDAFSDDTGNDFEDEINSLAARGVVNGTSPGIYSPANSVTRGSMGSFLARTLRVLSDDGATLTPI